MDWKRLRQQWDDPKFAGYKRWALPVAAALGVLLVLSPGLITQQAPDETDRRVMSSQGRESMPGGAAASEPQVFAMRAGPSPAARPNQPLSEPAADLASRFDCVIEPSETVELGSPVTGVLHEIHLDRGALVTAGQPVATLESSVERAAVELARARAQMEGALKSREASYELGQRRRARVNQLFESNTLSADLLDQTETEARIAELDLVEVQEHKMLASLELAQAQALLRRRTIRSPIDGVVVSRDMTAGEVVVDEKTIATLARIDPLRVEVILPSALYGTVQAGQRAAVEPEFGDGVHVAEVTIVDQVIDAASGTFGVRLDSTLR